MGMFDFVRNAGAKVGLGGGDKDAEAPAAADQEAREKRRAAAREQLQKARERRAAAMEAAKKEEAEDRRAQVLAKLAERRAEAAKSSELEQYVAGLGLEAEDLDIRFDDGTAFVEGTVTSQQDREKIILAVGNVEGVGKVDEEIEVVEPEPEAQMYTVVKGDTLSKIAKEYYGDAMKYPEIFEANRPMLKDPDLIYPGQVLRIPAL